MWISKRKYNDLQQEIYESERAKQAIREIQSIVKDGSICSPAYGVIAMSVNFYDGLFSQLEAFDQKVKDAKAECEWYKVKYGELLTKSRGSNGEEICNND